MKFKLLAVMSALSTFAITGNASAEPECVRSYGQTACGYHCESGYGMVECAKTPQGVCYAAYGQVKCWDPEVKSVENAQCIASYGQIACGYHCESGYGIVKCANTPQGVCHAAYGQVKCWDPEVKTDAPSQCMASYGQIACGYHCESGYGMVKCAETPQGICRASGGTVTCWDPEFRTQEDE